MTWDVPFVACMRKLSTLVLCTVSLLLLSSCSPRDFLTRRLAASSLFEQEALSARLV